jgi:hypothetical protein
MTERKASPASVKRAKARKAVDPEAHERAKARTLPKKPRQTSQPRRERAKQALAEMEKAVEPKTKSAALSNLAVAIRNLNVTLSMPATGRALAELTDKQKSKLRQHLPDVLDKLRSVLDALNHRR